jgi:aryl-alcohol dehydrogenase-like predicted oxidoreductase
MKALAISDKHGWERFVSLQAFYNLVAREVENELLPLCLDQGLGILAWSPLARGFLTGKFRRGQPRPAGTRLSKETVVMHFDEQRGFTIVEELEKIAQGYQASVAQAALNYLLRKPGMTSVIIGARTKEQLADLLKTTDWEMAPADVTRLDEVSQPPSLYPYWFLTENRHVR